MNDDVCCFKQEAYQPGTIIDRITADDGCTEMAVVCSPDGVVFENKNSCPKPATEIQVDKQTQVLDTKMDKLEELMENLKDSFEEKIENLTHSLEKCMAKTGNFLLNLKLKPTIISILRVI
jgi:hypothetical protein